MSTLKFNQGTRSNKELDKPTKFWNKKQFRTWNKKEIERDSNNMQALLAALKEFSADEIKAIRKLDGYSFRVYHRDDPKYIIWVADKKDLEYALSIAPKTFKVKQG